MAPCKTKALIERKFKQRRKGSRRDKFKRSTPLRPCGFKILARQRFKPPERYKSAAASPLRLEILVFVRREQIAALKALNFKWDLKITLR